MISVIDSAVGAALDEAPGPLDHPEHEGVAAVGRARVGRAPPRRTGRPASRSPARWAASTAPERRRTRSTAAGRAARPAGRTRGRRRRPRASAPRSQCATTRSRRPSSSSPRSPSDRPRSTISVASAVPDDRRGRARRWRRSAPPGRRPAPAGRRWPGPARRPRRRAAGSGPASSVKASPTASRAIRCTRSAGSSSPSAVERLVEQVVLLPVDQPHLEAAQAGREPQRRLGQRRGVAGPPGEVGRLPVEHPRAVEVGRVEQGRPGAAEQPRPGGVVDRDQVEGLAVEPGGVLPRLGVVRGARRLLGGRHDAVAVGERHGRAAGVRRPRRAARPGIVGGARGAAPGVGRPAWRRTPRRGRARATARGGHPPGAPGRWPRRRRARRRRRRSSSPASVADRVRARRPDPGRRRR